MQKDFPVFVSSADSYHDIWPVFFDLFKMHWPEYDGIIYLSTEEKVYDHEGLNIHCTQVGKLGSFGKIFRAGLDQVKSDHLLLMMIDYIFMSKVNDKNIRHYYNCFIELGFDSLLIIPSNFETQTPTSFEKIKKVGLPVPHLFSYQIAFWKKGILYKMALPHENPWTSEWYGSTRANKMRIQLGCLSESVETPILYDPHGCLDKGKWLNNAIEYLQKIDYPVDFKKRGIHEELPQKFKERLKIKWMLVRDGLSGSYWK